MPSPVVRFARFLRNFTPEYHPPEYHPPVANSNEYSHMENSFEHEADDDEEQDEFMECEHEYNEGAEEASCDEVENVSILKRRKSLLRPVTDEEELFDYQCQWEDGYISWESRERLEEHGYSDAVDTYDMKHSPYKKLPPHKVPAISVHPKQLEGELGGTEAILTFVKETLIQSKSSKALVRYAPVGNTALERRFIRTWFKRDDSFNPKVLYLGVEQNLVHHIGTVGVAENSSRMEGCGGAVEPLPVGYVRLSRLPEASLEYSDVEAVFLCACLLDPPFKNVIVSSCQKWVDVPVDSPCNSKPLHLVPLWLLHLRDKNSVEAAIVHDPIPFQFQELHQFLIRRKNDPDSM